MAGNVLVWFSQASCPQAGSSARLSAGTKLVSRCVQSNFATWFCLFPTALRAVYLRQSFCTVCAHSSRSLIVSTAHADTELLEAVRPLCQTRAWRHRLPR